LLVVQVFWLKDGERLDVDADVNLIISHEGSLIVSQARLSDSANYTCGAQNVAARRLTDLALLTVYGQSPTVTFPAAQRPRTQCRRTRSQHAPRIAAVKKAGVMPVSKKLSLSKLVVLISLP